jgi:predicted ATPase
VALELAPLDDDGPVSDAVAVALRVQQRHGLTIEQTVIEYLRGRELLLVLDNCEHVLEAAARLLDQVVRHCPGVVVLATSREALDVEGERILPLARCRSRTAPRSSPTALLGPRTVGRHVQRVGRRSAPSRPAGRQAVGGTREPLQRSDQRTCCRRRVKSVRIVVLSALLVRPARSGGLP